jgi:hypothetical protein
MLLTDAGSEGANRTIQHSIAELSALTRPDDKK